VHHKACFNHTFKKIHFIQPPYALRYTFAFLCINEVCHYLQSRQIEHVQAILRLHLYCNQMNLRRVLRIIFFDKSVCIKNRHISKGIPVDLIYIYCKKFRMLQLCSSQSHISLFHDIIIHKVTVTMPFYSFSLQLLDRVK